MCCWIRTGTLRLRTSACARRTFRTTRRLKRSAERLITSRPRLVTHQVAPTVTFNFTLAPKTDHFVSALWKVGWLVGVRRVAVRNVGWAAAVWRRGWRGAFRGNHGSQRIVSEKLKQGGERCLQGGECENANTCWKWILYVRLIPNSSWRKTRRSDWAAADRGKRMLGTTAFSGASTGRRLRTVKCSRRSSQKS